MATSFGPPPKNSLIPGSMIKLNKHLNSGKDTTGVMKKLRLATKIQLEGPGGFAQSPTGSSQNTATKPLQAPPPSMHLSITEKHDENGRRIHFKNLGEFQAYIKENVQNLMTCTKTHKNFTEQLY